MERSWRCVLVGAPEHWTGTGRQTVQDTSSQQGMENLRGVDDFAQRLVEVIRRRAQAELEAIVSSTWVTVSGTVVRSGTTKACKSMQGFQCTRCKRTVGCACITMPLPDLPPSCYETTLPPLSWLLPVFDLPAELPGQRVMSRCKLEDGGVAPAPQQCPGAPGQPCSGCKFRLQEEVTCFTGFQEIKVRARQQLIVTSAPYMKPLTLTLTHCSALRCAALSHRTPPTPMTKLTTRAAGQSTKASSSAGDRASRLSEAARAYLKPKRGQPQPSIAALAQQFSVPYATLHGVIKRGGVVAKRGRPTVLSAVAEQQLRDMVVGAQQQGVGVTKTALLAAVRTTQRVTERKGKVDPFKGKAPGKKWRQGFMRSAISGAPGQPCSGCKFRLQEEVTCFTGFQEIKVRARQQLIVTSAPYMKPLTLTLTHCSALRCAALSHRTPPTPMTKLTTRAAGQSTKASSSAGDRASRLSEAARAYLKPKRGQPQPSIAALAQQFSVPYATLHGVIKRGGVVAKRGRPTVLSAVAEQQLRDMVVGAQQQGVGVTKTALLAAVRTTQRVTERKGKVDPFKGKAPGKKWRQGFMRPLSPFNVHLHSAAHLAAHTQALHIGEQVQSYGAGAQPCALTVVLQDELVDRVAPGAPAPESNITFDFMDSTLVLTRAYIGVDHWWPLQNGVMAKKQGGLVRLPIHTAEAFQEFWAAHTTHPITARNKVVAAVCPQLHGLFLAKLALLLALVGGVARPESKLRGDAHLLMVGDPGVGKSQLMKFAARVAGRAVTASGKGSSSAGLTASAVKDDGVWVLEAGALVLADGGVCCIDEFDGIREADRATIHEAMEQQTVHIAKAGMMTKLSTRTTIIAAVNPRPGWRPHQPLTDACTLSGPLLSRFDMVLLLLDKAHPAWDMQVAACVLDNHVQGGQEAQQRSRQLLPAPHPPAGAGWTEQLPGSQAAPQALQGQGAGQGSSSSGGGGWNLDSLRDYLVWVKTTFQPCMSMEAHEVLQAYYVALRGMEERSAARTSLRALESLVRIAQAHARLCARNTVTLQDSVMAVLVVEATAGCLHVVPADHTLFSDFHPEPDTEYVQLEQQVLAALGLVHLRKPLQALTGPASPTSPIFLKVRPTSAPWSAASSKATLAYVALGATGASQDPPRSGAGFGGTQETCPQPRAHHHHQLPDHPHLSQPIKLGG
ncbi:hypothetical protein QJQ45_018922 [Haematococcus lacustris]|nr:hypothetical protein QJQ45_018922 [Haematococcus lacustris]